MVYLCCRLSTAYTICATWMQKELGKTLTKVHNRHPAQTPTEMASDPCNALKRNPVHVAFTVWRTCGEKDPTLRRVKALKILFPKDACEACLGWYPVKVDIGIFAAKFETPSSQWRAYGSGVIVGAPLGLPSVAGS